MIFGLFQSYSSKVYSQRLTKGFWASKCRSNAEAPVKHYELLCKPPH